jgi:hypothetical protein
MASVSDAIANAQKTLGKEGKIPKPKSDMAALGAAWTKAGQAFRKSITDLQTSLQALEKVTTLTRDGYKQYAGVIKDSDFGLDDGDDENKKKIDCAKKVILDAIQDGTDISDKSLSNLDKLCKIVSDLNRLNDLDV